MTREQAINLLKEHYWYVELKKDVQGFYNKYNINQSNYDYFEEQLKIIKGFVSNSAQYPAKKVTRFQLYTKNQFEELTNRIENIEKSRRALFWNLVGEPKFNELLQNGTFLSSEVRKSNEEKISKYYWRALMPIIILITSPIWFNILLLIFAVIYDKSSAVSIAIGILLALVLAGALIIGTPYYSWKYIKITNYKNRKPEDFYTDNNLRRYFLNQAETKESYNHFIYQSDAGIKLVTDIEDSTNELFQYTMDNIELKTIADYVFLGDAQWVLVDVNNLLSNHNYNIENYTTVEKLLFLRNKVIESNNARIENEKEQSKINAINQNTIAQLEMVNSIKEFQKSEEKRHEDIKRTLYR
ncbi:hypothetical protein RW115_11805 [Macrococcus capreoli]